MKNLHLSLFLLGVLTLTACQKDNSDPAPEPSVEEIIAKHYSGEIPVYGAVDDNTYAESLYNLYRAPFDETYPNLQELPLLGQIHEVITVDDIMERLIVSDDWMASNFRYVLESIPSSFLQLFKPITAIVITRDLKPSFYWPSTAAIYLDPYRFYINAEERATIPTKKDYRNDYGKDFQFVMPYTYYRKGEYLYPSERTKEEMRNIGFNLLAHELAHANDYISAINITDVPKEGYIRDYEHSLLSNKMTKNFPLQSEILKEVGNVRYQGKAITKKLKKLSPADIVSEFINDFSNDDYNYSTDREDFAMIFEEFAMKYYLDFDRGVAVTEKTEYFIVEWGQLGRIREDHLSEKINYVVSSLIPTLDVKSALSSFGDPIPFTKDLNWWENIDRIFITPHISSKYKTIRKATDDMLPPTD
ncbi:hypothetical protein ACXR6G_09430 [Ancylomarina sp. YFZ004]